LFVALICLSPLHAQTDGGAPAGSNPQAAAQAPEEMTAKITDLVKAGKNADALQLTNGLLVAYPDDQRLIKAKALLEKLLAPAASSPANAQPAGNLTPAQPAAGTTASTPNTPPEPGSIGVTLYGEGGKGAKVGYVIKGGPADQAGLLPGDLITAVNDTQVKDSEELTKVLNASAPGTTVAIAYLRKGEQKQTNVTLAARSALFGKGMPTFGKEIADSLRSLAEGGDTDAPAALCRTYLEGGDVAQDYSQAASWCRKAADQGNAAAQASLGTMYADGTGVSQDYAQALIWSRKAADQGNARGEAVLGWLYQSGKGVPQDSAQAVVWFRKAADHGNAYAQYSLGVAFAYGLGVPMDYAQAESWFRKSDAQQADAGPLTGLDKVDYNALIELGREAQQATDPDQQKKSLQELMVKSGPFILKHPHETLIWQLRAAAAIRLDAPFAGYQAGQELLAAGAAESSDPGVQNLLTQLSVKGWMDPKGAENAQTEINRKATGLGCVNASMKATYEKKKFTVIEVNMSWETDQQMTGFVKLQKANAQLTGTCKGSMPTPGSCIWSCDGVTPDALPRGK
jgi:TPR repeat protein